MTRGRLSYIGHRGSSVPPGCTTRTRDEGEDDIARKRNLEEPERARDLRVTARIARQTVTGCMRCLDTLEVPTNTWYSAEPEGGAVCAKCAQRDDLDGFAMVASYHRMAARPSLGRRRAA